MIFLEFHSWWMKKVHCDQCNYECEFISTLKLHKHTNHDGIKYKCDVCVYKTKRKNILRMHMKKIHSIEINSWFIWFCSWDCYVFTNKTVSVYICVVINCKGSDKGLNISAFVEIVTYSKYDLLSLTSIFKHFFVLNVGHRLEKGNGL